MLYIAKGKTQGYLDSEDIKNFSCLELRRIDENWKNHSHGHFGFGVQKKIWLDTGNRQEYNEEAVYKFLSQLRWNKWDLDMIYREVVKDYSKAPVGILPRDIATEKYSAYRILPAPYPEPPSPEMSEGRIDGIQYLIHGEFVSVLAHVSANCNI